jgi:hypothetical protein
MAVTVRQGEDMQLWFCKAHHSNFELRTGYDVGTAAKAVPFTVARGQIATGSGCNGGLLRRLRRRDVSCLAELGSAHIDDCPQQEQDRDKSLHENMHSAHMIADTAP